MEHVYRTCPLCEAHCGIDVAVDRPAGTVSTIKGDKADSFSRGFLCPKAYGLKGLQEDPDRLRRPLVRDGGDYREVDWPTALDRAADGLRRLRDAHGPDSIAIYIGNPTVHDMGSLLYLPVLMQTLGTRWIFSAASVDQLPKTLACRLLFGGSYTIPIPDLDRTEHLLVLGANPAVSNGSLMTAPDVPGRLKRLRERGGKLVVVDPRRSETAARADEHHFIRPGGDAFLLFAMIHTLFEEDRVSLGALAERVTGMDAVAQIAKDFAPETVGAATGMAPDVIRHLARDFANAPSAACYGRVGTCTQRFGMLASWGVDVLNVLTGNLDRVGGAMFPKPAVDLGGAFAGPDDAFPYARWHSRVRGLPEFDGQLPAAALAEEIDTAGDERVRGLITLAGNPVLSTPNGARMDGALDELDFMVSIDLYRNETTRHADVILPPTSPLERSNCDLFFYPLAVRNVIYYSPPALEPPPDALHQWQISLELAARLAGTTADALEQIVVGLVADGSGAGTQALASVGDTPGPDRLLDLFLRGGPYDLKLSDLGPHGTDLGALEPRLDDVLATPSGQIELAPGMVLADIERLRAARDEPRRSLELIGRRHVRSNNSWMHNVHALAKGPERCTLLIHPEDAAARGIATGTRVAVRSRVGEVVVPAVVSDEVMPGVVSIPHGFGHDATRAQLDTAAKHQRGVNSNLLADETLIDAPSGTAVVNGVPVEVSPAG